MASLSAPPAVSRRDPTVTGLHACAVTIYAVTTGAWLTGGVTLKSLKLLHVTPSYAFTLSPSPTVLPATNVVCTRSEERRVGKECGYWMAPLTSKWQLLASPLLSYS